MVLACVLFMPLSGCGSGSGSGSGSQQPAVNQPTRYTTFAGESVILHAWEGRNIALLTRSSTHQPSVMALLLDGIDRGYDYYLSAASQPPPSAGTSRFNGKLIIAEVDRTCGAGCGYLGATGIEIQSEFFDILYNGVLTAGTFDQVVFYELGRNFWLYESTLGYVMPDDRGTVNTGFAVLMRLLSIEASGVNPGPMCALSWDRFRSEWIALADTYINDPRYRWSNTLQVGEGVDNPLGLGAADLLGSLLYDTAVRYSPDPLEFFRHLWIIGATRPLRRTSYDAVDNLVLAASAAVDTNLTNHFMLRLKWPVSLAAILEAQLRFGPPAKGGRQAVVDWRPPGAGAVAPSDGSPKYEIVGTDCPGRLSDF